MNHIETKKRENGRTRVLLHTGKGLTEQAHKKETDLNYILRDAQKSGLIRHVNKNPGRYDDVPAIDYQQAMFLVTQAQNMFQDLPSNIRNRFGNDPAKFLEFVENPSNKEEIDRMGLGKGTDGLRATGEAIPGGEADNPAQKEPEKPPAEPSAKTDTP